MTIFTSYHRHKMYGTMKLSSFVRSFISFKEARIQIRMISYKALSKTVLIILDNEIK